MTQTMVEGVAMYLHDGHEREPALAVCGAVSSSLEAGTTAPCSTTFVIVLSLHRPPMTVMVSAAVARRVKDG